MKNTHISVKNITILSIGVLAMFVLAYAGINPSTASATCVSSCGGTGPTESILMNYDNLGEGKDPDCALLPDAGGCVPLGNGQKSDNNEIGSPTFNFCLNSAVKYASGMTDISGLDVSYEQIDKRPPYCLSDEGNGSYITLKVSYSPKNNCTNLTVSCSSNSSSIPTGQSAAFTANPSGGMGFYTYSWSGACVGSGSTCSNSFFTAGAKTAAVTVISGCQTALATCSVSVYDVACSTNSQCGTNGFVGDPFCQGNNVYRNYKTYTCNNPGAANSYCSDSTQAQLQTTCTGNQICTNGSCANQNIACSSNFQCGIDGYVGDPFCQANNVYRNYRTYTCNNPGTANSYCSNFTVAQLQTTCSYNQTCSNGSCTNTCTPNYQQRCSGNNLYWYDSCGNQQSLIQYCQCGCSGNYCQTCNYTNASLNVTKTVRNLSAGSGFSSSTYASPSDVVMFMITLQATGNQDVQNVYVRDTLPANLIYNNQLVVAGSNNYNNYSGNITSGINLNTISAGQTVTITYQAQVASAANFSFGTTTLTNSVYVTSSASGYTPTANASVIVTRSGVLGASTISTGLTNNFWVDSFLLPLAITLLAIWMWRSGLFFGVEKWLGSKKKARQGYLSEKELSSRIASIQKLGKT